MLSFKAEYRKTGHVGMAINSGHYDQRQKLVDALEALADVASGDLSLYVDGSPVTLTCYRILGQLQDQAMKDHGQIRVYEK